MAVALIKPDYKVSPQFPFPANDKGSVDICIETTAPVDVFVCSKEQAATINSLIGAQEAGIMNFPRCLGLKESITLPPEWKGGWCLTIGHTQEFSDQVAVYYSVNL